MGAEPMKDESFTYSSTQATNCASCGEHKHTPLRIDNMGGYVCLTCIDKKLGSLLGEFGYPPPEGWRGDIQKVIDSLDPDDWCGDESMITALNRALGSAQPEALDCNQSLESKPAAPLDFETWFASEECGKNAPQKHYPITYSGMEEMAKDYMRYAWNTARNITPPSASPNPPRLD